MFTYRVKTTLGIVHVRASHAHQAALEAWRSGHRGAILAVDVVPCTELVLQ
jgi:hypothetical protein